jgi:branched-chain amino acid transport system substrate-binding protein
MTRKLLRCALTTAAILLAAGCGQKSEPRDGTLAIRIGQVSPLTGPQAHLGRDNDNGARLAVDEINAQGLTLGGKPARIELRSEDDAADPKTATTVAQKLVDEGVVAVVGHLNSGATIPASKIYADAGIPQISPSATAIAYTAQGFRTAFRVMTNDAQQGSVLGRYAVQKLGARRVAIIDDRTAYGQGLADEVAKAVSAAGGEVVAREYTSDRATDFMAILTSIKAKSPDLVFFGGMDPQAAPMVKQLKQLGVNARFLGGDGVQTPKFVELAGAEAEGTIASNPGLPLDAMPGGAAFKSKFEAKYGKIQNYAPYAYDAVYVLVEAMRRAQSSEPAKVLAELPKTDYQGVTGRIRFDAKGDITGGAVTLYQVRDGKWVTLETVQSAQ